MIAHAMYALECEMVPGEVDDEGPFAEVTGYYAKRAPRPVVHVKAIHHRKAAGLPDHPLGRRGLELGRPARRGERHGAAPAPGAGRQGRLLQPRRLRLLPLRRRACGRCAPGWSKQAIMATFAAFPPLKMVTVVDDDVDIRKPDGRRVGDDHPPRPLDRRDHDPGMLRPRPQPELPGLQGHQDRLRLHAPVPLHPRLRPRRLQGGRRSTTTSSKAAGARSMDGRFEEFACRPAKAGLAFAGHARSSAPPAARVKDLSTGAPAALVARP